MLVFRMLSHEKTNCISQLLSPRILLRNEGVNYITNKCGRLVLFLFVLKVKNKTEVTKQGHSRQAQTPHKPRPKSSRFESL